MIKETIKYMSFDDEERTEDFYFNISSGEMTELEFVSGGLGDYLTRIADAKDKALLLKAFRDFLKIGYGRKSEDGRNFIKREEDWLGFYSSEAYSALLIKLLGNTDYAVEFIKGMFPKNIDSTFQAHLDGEGIVTRPAPQDRLPKKTSGVTTVREENRVSPVAPRETEDEMRTRLRAELLAENTPTQPLGRHSDTPLD